MSGPQSQQWSRISMKIKLSMPLFCLPRNWEDDCGQIGTFAAKLSDHFAPISKSRVRYLLLNGGSFHLQILPPNQSSFRYRRLIFQERIHSKSSGLFSDLLNVVPFNLTKFAIYTVLYNLF